MVEESRSLHIDRNILLDKLFVNTINMESKCLGMEL